MAAQPPSLGTRIRIARERKKMSQQELAAAVGASVRAVGDWENDRRKPRNRLGAVEEVLGVSLYGEPEASPSMPKSLLREIEATLGGDERQAVIDAVERTLARERGASGSSPPSAGPERRRPAS